MKIIKITYAVISTKSLYFINEELHFIPLENYLQTPKKKKNKRKKKKKKVFPPDNLWVFMK